MTTMVSDTGALVGRQMLHLVRVPEKLLAIAIMPVSYLVIFGYLFGAAMSVPGGNYREYLMAGILAQTMLSGITSTGLGVADDLNGGLIDRLRALPITQTSVLLSRTVANVMTSAVSVAVMAAVGLLIGWKINTDFWHAAAGFGVLLLFGFAMSWLGVVIGLMLRTAEAITSVAFVIVLPVTFLSNAFIPLEGLPGWLRVVCSLNPMSWVVQATRELFGNPSGAGASVVAPTHPVAWAVGLSAALTVVFAALAVAAYRRESK